ncbi:hypothetical protein JXQ70_13830 [bacterium]|nr:hypothetical protein [bacterium]
MKRITLLLACVVGLLFCTTPIGAVEWSVGLADYWGNFTLGYEEYEVTFEVDGIGLLGFNTEVRFLDNKLGVGLNYVSGKYSFEGSGTTGDDEEIEAEGDRKRTDLDFWLKYSPSQHFAVFAGYKQLAFDFDDIYVLWTEPDEKAGQELYGEADVDMSGFQIGAQTMFGRRLLTAISLAYFPSLSGDVDWDGYKVLVNGTVEPDTGSSTVDSQGLKFQLNLVKPFPSISSALTVGYYLQMVFDEFDSLNYKADELFTGIMVGFTYTFRFAQHTEVDVEEVE